MIKQLFHKHYFTLNQIDNTERGKESHVVQNFIIIKKDYITFALVSFYNSCDGNN